ncbi:GNAT family N-acetyltransferase [Planococcus sp. SIMBA_160]
MMIEYESCHQEGVLLLFSDLPAVHMGIPVRQLLSAYELLPERHLYVWQHHEKVVGVIGIHKQKQTFAVHHISVHPSFRNQGIGSSLVHGVQELHLHLAMCSTQETKHFLNKCWQKQSLLG